jgi:superfamily II DNA or RNA helicase
MTISKLLKKIKQQKTNQEEYNSVSEPTLFISNSFCTLSKFPKELEEVVRDLLTYENEGVEQELIQKYRLLKMARSRHQHKFATKLEFEIETLKEQKEICLLKGNEFPTGLLTLVKDELPKSVKIIDKRVKPETRHFFRLKNPFPELRYYQQEMLKEGLQEGRGVFEAGVGIGKSYVMMALTKELGLNTLVIVPASSLLEQLYRGFALHFGKTKVEKITTKAVKADKISKPIRFVTIQTLASLEKQGLLKKVLKDIDVIHFEELHHAASTSYTKLMRYSNHIYHKYGFTGTWERGDGRILELYGVLGNQLYHYPAYQAIEEGYLTPVKLKVRTLNGKSNKDYQKEYKFNYGGSKEFLEAIAQIIETDAKNKQTLILVDRKESCGDIIYKYLADKGIDSTYISGDDTKEHINDTIEAFNEGEIGILIGSTVIGEGIDIKSTEHLIMGRGGKSPIAITQAIGRAVRLKPGKKLAVVHDFYFKNTKYLGKHLEQRIDIFKNKFDGEIEECD